MKAKILINKGLLPIVAVFFVCVNGYSWLKPGDFGSIKMQSGKENSLLSLSSFFGIRK